MTSSEIHTAQLFGLTLGLVLTALLTLNALAF